MRFDGNWSLDTLMLQRGGQFFDPDGNVAFATEDTADLIRWYILQTRGPNKIGYECGWGQPVAKALIDGLVIFEWTPDWRSWVLEDEVPSLKGKMALMPLPAWKPGGRRTSVWGGTGLIITKATKNPELAWEFAKYLYTDTPELGKRFLATNIIPVLKDAWKLPELDHPNPYWSNQPIGRMYAELAPDTPALYSSPVDAQARTKLDEAYALSAEYYTKHGEAGLMDAIRANLAKCAADVRRYADRESKLRVAR
jgi:ABC-type glycerol-3-phosphate transport system substrate-binding protein